jgi:hypothetical protein
MDEATTNEQRQSPDERHEKFTAISDGDDDEHEQFKAISVDGVHVHFARRTTRRERTNGDDHERRTASEHGEQRTRTTNAANYLLHAVINKRKEDSKNPVAITKLAE